MEYLTPPRAALALLNLFASEPDLAHVVGDLSAEFQQRASAHGHRAAKLWYWQETFRNAMVLGKRELLRTPGKVLAASLLTGVNSDLLIALVMGPVLEHIQGPGFLTVSGPGTGRIGRSSFRLCSSLPLVLLRAFL